MWKLSAAVLVLMSSMCSGFLIGQNSTDLLMYFREASVTLVSNNAPEPKRMNYSSENTEVKFEFTPADDKQSIQVQLDFQGPADSFISVFAMNMTITTGTNGYWRMTEATASVTAKAEGLNIVGAKLISGTTMEAPNGQSFSCSRFGKMYPDFNVKSGNWTPVIEISGLQIQAFNVTEGKFGDNWECVGFFTIGIWSGIFITAILISIITWGLCMIMDVKTMDRFDDPKGKPIAFGTTE